MKKIIFIVIFYGTWAFAETSDCAVKMYKAATLMFLHDTIKMSPSACTEKTTGFECTVQVLENEEATNVVYDLTLNTNRDCNKISGRVFGKLLPEIDLASEPEGCGSSVIIAILDLLRTKQQRTPRALCTSTKSTDPKKAIKCFVSLKMNGLFEDISVDLDKECNTGKFNRNKITYTFQGGPPRPSRPVVTPGRSN